MREISGALACGLGVGVLAIVTAGAPANAAADVPSCLYREGTIVGTKRADVLRGTPGDDVFVARGGNDVAYGRGGDDVMCGGDGADRLFGGDGSDRFHGGQGGDSLYGGAASDSFPSEPGDDSVSGGPGDDIVRPWRSGLDRGDHDIVSTGIGNDLIEMVSALGGMTVDAGAGDDVVEAITGAGQPTSLTGGAGTDRLEMQLGVSPEELRLDQSADRFKWGGGIGRFSGWDEIELYGEVDLTFVGHEGADLLTIFGNGAVTASTLGGNDGVWGFYNDGAYHLDGGEGDDDLVGGDGNDVLRGGPGADFLDGWNGDDFLDGGTGTERTLWGGHGTDTAQDPDDDPETAACQDIEMGFCAESPSTP